LKLSGEARRRA